MDDVTRSLASHGTTLPRLGPGHCCGFRSLYGNVSSPGRTTYCIV